MYGLIGKLYTIKSFINDRNNVIHCKGMYNMEEPIKTKDVSVNLYFSDIATVRIIKSNTSLHITIPSNWKEDHYLEAGDKMEIAILKIHKKQKEEKKKNNENK